MSKKHKNKWYWRKEDESIPTAVTSRKHRVFDENGNEVTDEQDDYWGYSGGDWNRKPTITTKHHSEIDWDSYNKGGAWKGYDYYKPSTLSYSYVNQMANMISSQHKVNTQIGNDWSIDLDKKILTYNPVALMKMTKGEVLATLLHEVGKISLCESAKNISNPFVSKYGDNAYKVISAFDDFRVDDKMINSYPSAVEVYDSQTGILKKVVQAYNTRAEIYARVLQQMIDNQYNMVQKVKSDNPSASFESVFKHVTKENSPLTSFAEYDKWYNEMCNKPFRSIWNYLSIVVDKGYGVNCHKHDQDMEDRFTKTSPAVGTAVSLATTQEMADDMNTSVFPHVEDLLKNHKEGSDDMKEGMGEGASKAMMKSLEAHIESAIDPRSDVGKAKQLSRGQMAGDNSLPREWMEGDYKALKDSVTEEIKSLYTKMINLRRQEQTIRYADHQRRGKLNAKVLYKHRMGANRLFRKKEENVDTIRSFTFSIMVDSSGSMSGSKMTHTTRALIMLSEVFTKLGMAFEIIHFETDPTITKTFEQGYDKSVQKDVAKYVKCDGGGTRLGSALKASGLPKRHEMNRVAIILTDGDTESHDELNARFFTPWDKQGVKSIVLGLETSESSIRGLNNGKGLAIKNAAEMPKLFYDLLKGLIFKK